MTGYAKSDTKIGNIPLVGNERVTLAIWAGCA
jgi:hypothetical protein